MDFAIVSIPYYVGYGYSYYQSFWFSYGCRNYGGYPAYGWHGGGFLCSRR